MKASLLTGGALVGASLLVWVALAGDGRGPATGAVATIDQVDICAKSKTPEGWWLTYSRRHRKFLLPEEEKADFARAGFAWQNELEWRDLRKKYELDHIVPLCAGGADTPANRRPEIWSEAHEKDEIEASVCRAICDRQLGVEEGQAIFLKGSWRAFIGGNP